MGATKVYLSTLDAVVDPAAATISVFDRGFLYGDSVYETMRTVAGVPVERARHLARLHRSADGIGLGIPWSDDALADALARTHAATGNDESYVRMIVTRGVGPLMLDPRRSEEPTLVVIAMPLVLPDAAAYSRGISAVIVGTTKVQGGMLDPAIKSGNYLGSILALRQAIAAGGEDAILCTPTGEIAEGATSNVFFVRDGVVCTPDLQAGLLAGITREVVCELVVALGLTLRTERVLPEQLRAADEVFLTSSVRGIMPVTTLDGRTVGNGSAGPITVRLSARYEAYLASLR
ncbi:MAG: aminotransferase class IV [Nannocystaceae bacterium]|nr:aminotransferase class IV [Nannocystaceae bacterium]